ncbi:MAG: sporulation protein YunB [Selenomonadales bacterium]|nr:sporulation protein YunB [Selenomonadales bacterium]
MKYHLAIATPNKRILTIFIVITLLCNTFLWIDNELRPTLYIIAENKINRHATTIISRTVENIIKEQGQEALRVHTILDERGKVILVQPDTTQYNAITAAITNNIETELSALADIPINIPLGQLSKISFLAGRGPEIPIYMKPTGKIIVRPQNQFEHIGINQTKHSMYIDIMIDIRIIIPFTEETTTVQTTIPLTEYIVVGDVPQTYVEIPHNILK